MDDYIAVGQNSCFAVLFIYRDMVGAKIKRGARSLQPAFRAARGPWDANGTWDHGAPGRGDEV